MTAILDARSESEAVRQYTEALQRAIAAFGENVFLVRGAFDVAANAHTLALARGASMALLNSAGERRLAFRPEFYFRTAQLASPPRRWTVLTVAYAYRLDDARVSRQLVGYHWHPHVQGIPFPHVHLLAAPAELRRLHIAVGHCTLEHVLTLAMRDFGVQPVRNDWRTALDACSRMLNGAALATLRAITHECSRSDYGVDGLLRIASQGRHQLWVALERGQPWCSNAPFLKVHQTICGQQGSGAWTVRTLQLFPRPLIVGEARQTRYTGANVADVTRRASAPRAAMMMRQTRLPASEAGG